jgi:hypothetical protein
VQQWRCGEDKGEEEVEERRKMEREEEEEISPPSVAFCIRHWTTAMVFSYSTAICIIYYNCELSRVVDQWVMYFSI